MQESTAVKVQETVHGSYEARKKAFKAAGTHTSGHIPVNKNSQHWQPSRFTDGNNRKETNSRGVSPRMLDVQRIPKEVRIPGTASDGTKVVARVKAMSMRKVYHIRPVK